ncbi:MAG TPA: EAL domain-containing protein, partial [Methylomirabilota bacterium]|nr:EAL domain-containing protein [Methylomirabilota bacterium]
LSLDDFGTGYSSLLYLMRLPVHEIKIDRSFVAGLGTDSDSGAIVRSAVGLGHNLGLRVVAEGLQDRLAEAVLIEAGCDAAQGFLFGRPVTDAEMTTQLMTNPGSKGIPIEPGAQEGVTAAALVQEGGDPKGI